MAGRSINSIAQDVAPILRRTSGDQQVNKLAVAHHAHLIGHAAMRGMIYDLQRSRPVGTKKADHQLARLERKANELEQLIAEFGQDTLQAYDAAIESIEPEQIGPDRFPPPVIPSERARLLALAKTAANARSYVPADCSAPRGRVPAHRAAEIADACADAYAELTGSAPSFTTYKQVAEGPFVNLVAAVFQATGETASVDAVSRAAVKRWKRRREEKGTQSPD